MRLAAALSLLALTAPAMGQSQPLDDIGALAWVRSMTGFPLEMRAIGTVTIAPGGVIVADPLTFFSAAGSPAIPAPAGSAQFIVALDAETGRVSKALLVFSAAPVACGRDEATVGVDTGLAAFLDQPTALALANLAQAVSPDRNIYDDWFNRFIGASQVVADLVPLPSGESVPMMSSGWGDGGYPVASLSDAEGRMVAVYADFMGINEDGDWLLPQECDPPEVTRLIDPSFPPSNL
jgi:hypothetical protein